MNKQKDITDLKEAIQMEISLIKTEISKFQNEIRRSDGKLPKAPLYPKDITGRIGKLKYCGITAKTLSLFLGVSTTAVRNWFNANETNKPSPEEIHKSTSSNIKELKILDFHKDKIKNTPVGNPEYVDKQTARIIFKSGVVIEISELSVLKQLSVWINGQSANINGGIQ